MLLHIFSFRFHNELPLFLLVSSNFVLLTSSTICGVESVEQHGGQAGQEGQAFSREGEKGMISLRYNVQVLENKVHG